MLRQPSQGAVSEGVLASGARAACLCRGAAWVWPAPFTPHLEWNPFCLSFLSAEQELLAAGVAADIEFDLYVAVEENEALLALLMESDDEDGEMEEVADEGE